MTKILVFAGSLRAGSFNKKLARVAAAALEKAGAEISFVDLKEFPMPPYDGDIQDKSGLPDTAIKLKKLIRESDGVLIVTPEYNYSVPGVLKNVLDWTSRAHEPNEKPLEIYNGKLFATMSASPGAAGGLRGLLHLRVVLDGMGGFVLPGQITLAKAAEAFNDDGTLKDEKKQAEIDALAKKLVSVADRLAA